MDCALPKTLTTQRQAISGAARCGAPSHQSASAGTETGRSSISTTSATRLPWRFSLMAPSSSITNTESFLNRRHGKARSSASEVASLLGPLGGSKTISPLGRAGACYNTTGMIGTADRNTGGHLVYMHFKANTASQPTPLQAQMQQRARWWRCTAERRCEVRGHLCRKLVK